MQDTSRSCARGGPRWIGLWRGKRGSELVEFAVIAPLLMMVLFGMYWFGRAYNIYETLTRAAREGAAYAARPVCGTCNIVGNGELPGFPSSGEIGDNVVIPALNAAHIKESDLAAISKPNVAGCSQVFNNLPTSPCPQSGTKSSASCYSYKGQNKIWVCRCVDMNPNSSPSECGVSISLAYPWMFNFPFTGLDKVVINIPASVQQRQEF